MPSEEPTPEFSFSELLKDLYYPSESDEPVDFVNVPVQFEPPLTIGHVRDLLLITPEIYVEEIPEAAFWEPVVMDQDGYEEEEKRRTVRFAELRQQIESILMNRQVFRVGEVEVALYLLGRKADGFWAGLKTTVVETT
ncbi:nuclease A inhibitor-like protein [Larkinella arboricola]|uniref:Nuclease A inhibitor-like protein n=1 Tax=Larkinella arboricola TaxID=643671 RepID=A0A327X2H4_LARAB|nr:nuclease A inhibitor family protein [Larkinella arboricola]RAK00330.1 nuclease A inhibitor-like protein [Larkinella arboricola]